MSDEKKLVGSTPQIVRLMHRDLIAKQWLGETDSKLATQKMRQMLLVREGGANAYKSARELHWGTELDPDDATVIRQGICTSEGGHFLSDVLMILMSDDVVRQRISQLFPEIDKNMPDVIAEVLYRVFKNLEYHSLDAQVEVGDEKDIDIDHWNSFMEKYYDFFREEYGDEPFD